MTVKVNSEGLVEALEMILPTQGELQFAVEALNESMRERMFPEDRGGETPTGAPYTPSYSTKPIYSSKSKEPAPVGGRPTKGGSGKTVFYEGGYSEYRRNLGLPSGEQVNLRLTGRLAAGLQGHAVGGKAAQIFFDPAVGRLAGELHDKYGFFGLSAGEVTFFETEIAQIIERKALEASRR